MTLRDVPVGSIVTDKKTRFNNKPIEWLVADHEKYSGTVLLSKDILCCRSFDEPKKSYKNADRSAYSAEFGVRPACVIFGSVPVKRRKNGGYKFYWKGVR